MAQAAVPQGLPLLGAAFAKDGLQSDNRQGDSHAVFPV